MSNPTGRNGLVMTLTGAVMLLASVLYLFLVEDPFPMWLILGGAGVMFLGVGATIRRSRPGRTLE